MDNEKEKEDFSLNLYYYLESDNDLAREQPGTVMNPIKQPDLELLRNFVNVPQMDSKTNSADGKSYTSGNIYQYVNVYLLISIISCYILL